MINYTLKCDQNHTFDSWFKSAEAFEMLVKKSMVVCSECGSTKITKAIMAPSISTSRKKDNKHPKLEKKSKLKNDILELKKKKFIMKLQAKDCEIQTRLKMNI